jgi:Putative lumazine-binding
MAASETEDERAVVAVARDYFEGYFDGNAARLGGALHRELAKRSLGQVDPESDALRSVTRDQMVGFTEGGEGRKLDTGGDRGIEVEVTDLHHNIASVTVRSDVYREYLQLVRTAEGWKIVNALWAWTTGPPDRA